MDRWRSESEDAVDSICCLNVSGLFFGLADCGFDGVYARTFIS